MLLWNFSSNVLFKFIWQIGEPSYTSASNQGSDSFPISFLSYALRLLSDCVFIFLFSCILEYWQFFSRTLVLWRFSDGCVRRFPMFEFYKRGIIIVIFFSKIVHVLIISHDQYQWKNFGIPSLCNKTLIQLHRIDLFTVIYPNG